MSVNRLSRQKSVMSIESNPLENNDDNNNNNSTDIKVEILTDTVPITAEQLQNEIISSLSFIDENEDKLERLEEVKQPYTFTSDDLAKILEVTPSLKTKIAMIAAIAPRLTDPSAKTIYFTDLFRFNEDKKKVEEILRARTQTLKSSNFARTGEGGSSMLQSRFLSGRGGGPSRRGSAPGSFASMSGRGGRGRGLPITNSAQQLSPADNTLHSIKESVSGKQTSRSSSNLPALSATGKSPPSALLRNEHNSSIHSLLSDESYDDEVTDDLGLDHSKDSSDASPSSLPRRRTSAPELSNSAIAAARAMKPPLGQHGSDNTDSEILSNNNSPSDCEELTIDISNETSNAKPFQTSLPMSGISSPRSPRGGYESGSPSLPRCSSKGSYTGSRAESPATVTTATGEEYELKNEAAVIAPGFVITARAPQRGPTPPPRKLSSVGNNSGTVGSTGVSSTNSSRSSTPSTARRGTKKSEKEKESTVKPMIANLKNKFERNPNTVDGAGGGIAAAGIEDLAGPPTAVQKQGDVGAGKSRKVSHLILDRVNSLKEPKSTKSSQAALEAQAEIAAGKMFRSQSHEEHDDEVENVLTPDKRMDRSLSLDGDRNEFFISPETTKEFRNTTPIAPRNENSKKNKAVSEMSMAISSSSSYSSKVSTGVWEAQQAVAAARLLRSQSIDEGDEDNDEFSPSGSIKFGDVKLRSSSNTSDVESSIHSPIKKTNSDKYGFKAYSTTTTPEQRSNPHKGIAGNSKLTSFSCNNTPDKPSAAPNKRPSGTGLLMHMNSVSVSKSNSEECRSEKGGRLKRASSEYKMDKSGSTKSITAAGWPANISAVGSGKGSDVAMMCASLLNMTKSEFLSLEEEAPIQGEPGMGIGKEFYNYSELVRRNYTKEYLGLDQTQLEKYISDVEFQLVFSKTKDEFAKQPRWRQMEQKKKAMMF